MLSFYTLFFEDGGSIEGRDMRLFDVFTTAADKLTDKIKGPPTSLELKTRFTRAVFAGHTGRLRRALGGGAQPDVNIGWDGEFQDLSSFAMMRATRKSDREMIDILLEYGADIDKNLDSFYAANPLSAAAVSGDTRMVEFLLDRGADPEKAVTTFKSPGGLLEHLAKQGLTDVHDLIKAALEAQQEEKAAPKAAVPAAPPQQDDDGDPITAPKTASFTKTRRVAAAP